MEWVPDLRQIRAFVAVAEQGSFTLAAKKIFVTQSAVSHAMRSLEDQLSCQLLDRSSKRVTLTNEGEMVLKRCKRILLEIELAGRDVDSLRRWGQTRIRIGAPHSLCSSLLPLVLREFRDCFPRCEPSIEAADTASLVQMLGASELDVVIGLRPRGLNPEAYRMLHCDQMHFLVSPTHPWASESFGADHSINDQHYIVYARGTETHRLAMDWMEARGGRIKKPTVLGDMQAIREMVKLGMGVGILAPWVAAREIEDGGLCLIPMPDGGIEREWGAYYSSKKSLSLVENAFIDLCGLAFDMIDEKNAATA